MPQALFLLIVAAGIYIFYKRFVAEARKASERANARRREVETGANGTLVKDPETGEYRVVRDDSE
jgi:membrane protein implicated in regulation of membrane protease activity